ncbi:GMC oxidoreductase [Archangium lipolyticum]|uniref:GMC oxidoreductase n=1 Tax=Archangium lipolyticum TaxID=2970465 RepID=UPI002149CDF7|nr:GMC family oxidoreductase [Archangium lipolyticum]
MRFCIVGSGVAGTVIARAMLERGDEVVMVEAGPRVTMRERRKWLDFVTTGVRPYHSCEDTQENVNRRFQESAPGSTTFELKGGRLMGVGGSTLHWSGWTPRFQPEDFELHSRTGLGRDWPFTYAQLEPYYCEAERLLNVTGPSAPRSGHPTPWRSVHYPWDSPPFPEATEELRGALDSMGITYDHVPLSRRGPGGESPGLPCMAVGTCRYCPLGARFDPTLLLETLEQRPGFRLLSDSPVLRLELSKGQVAAAVYRTAEGGEARVEADVFVVASGALETPKLLWRSGLDERRLPMLGRFLTSHPMLTVRGVARSSRAFNGREVPMPGLFSRHFDTPEHQAQGKFMFADYPQHPSPQTWVRKGMDAAYVERFARDNVIELHGFIEEIPDESNRIVLGPSSPLRQVEVEYHSRTGFPERLRWAEQKMKQVLRASGCPEDTIQTVETTRRADHSIGTVRFGDDERTGVVDARHRTFGTTNLYALSNGNFPNGSVVNPTLTLTAMCLRWAREVLPTL